MNAGILSNASSRCASTAGVAVIGAGAAGLMAAIRAAEQGAAVTVFEQLPEPGAKLKATGGGHCNFTNTLSAELFMARFGREGRFMQPALSALDSDGLREFFAGLGEPSHALDGFHVFPRSNSAKRMLAALVRRCAGLQVDIRVDTRVTELAVAGGRLRGAVAGGRLIAAGSAVVATGGLSYPALGGTGGGYALAKQAGHQVVSLCPALVPLITRETWPARLTGITLPRASLRIDMPGWGRDGAEGPLLFTHRGVSGPAVLDLSGQVSQTLLKQEAVPLRLDFDTDITRQDWMRTFDTWRVEGGTRQILTRLRATAPESVGRTVCELAGIRPEVKCAELRASAAARLADVLTAAPLTVTGTEGFAKAMVTRGGVSLKEVRPETLESRLVVGLFFAGEVLDLCGPCGGYNLQWAFSSGRLAGNSAVQAGS